MVVDIDTTDGFRAGTPRGLFESTGGGTTPLRSYDITADGQRFIGFRVVNDPEPPITQMHVVLNWVEELKRRVPVD
jgi:hypothetical protein